MAFLSSNNAGSLKHQNIINEEQLKLNLASAKSNNYNSTLMLKLFSGGFTQKDKNILKNILGKENINDLKIEDLNKISSFMWSRDNNGNIVGLSAEFMALLNGLGYLHNKN